MATIIQPRKQKPGIYLLKLINACTAAKTIAVGQNPIADMLIITPNEGVKPSYLPQMSDLALLPKVFKVYIQWVLYTHGGSKGYGVQHVLPHSIIDIVDPSSEILVVKETCDLPTGEHTTIILGYRNYFKLFNVEDPLTVTTIKFQSGNYSNNPLDGRFLLLTISVKQSPIPTKPRKFAKQRNIVWNCKHMGRESFASAIASTVEIHKPDVVILTETRVSIDMARFICSLLKPVDVYGRSQVTGEGGYVMISFSKQITMCIMVSSNEGTSWRLKLPEEQHDF